MTKDLPLLVATCVAYFSLASHADTMVIGDFDDGTIQGWVATGFRGVSVVPDPFTGNGFLLAIDWDSSGFDWTLRLYDISNPDLFLLNNSAGPQIVEFDIYWDPPSDWTGNGWMEWPQIAYNYASGWTNIVCSPSCAPPYSSTTVSGPAAGSLVWDFVANGPPGGLTGAPTSFADLWIGTDSGDNDPLDPVTQGTYYIDNITITFAPRQPILVDFGTSYGTPAASYGAASGDSGTWNQAGLGVTPLVDATGASAGASVDVAAGDGTGNTGSPPANDDDLLLDDNFFSSGGASWSANLSGLARGVYRVYLYAPSNLVVPTGDMTVGGEAAASIPGHTGSALIEGTSWVSVPVTVTASSLPISGAGSDHSGLAGLQVVWLPEPGRLLLIAGGLVALALLQHRPRIARPT